MAALDVIASELLKSANEADLKYKNTRDLAERDRAIRLRKIVENLRLLVLGASELNELTDVTISSPTDGQLLTYNSSTSQWENETLVIPKPGLYAQTASGTAVTGIAPQTLINGGVGSMTVPANGFQVGDSFIAYFSGKMSSVNNAVLEIHVVADGDTLADTGPMTLFAATNKDWEMFINFTIRTIGASGVASIATSGRFLYNKDSGAQPESDGFFNLNNTTFDTTISNTLNVTAQWDSVNPLNSIQTDMFNLYRIY
jgi:adenylate cyclase class IV